MKIHLHIPFLLFFCLLLVGACSSDEDIEGCTNPSSDNYNPSATIDDGSCLLERDIFLGNYQGAFADCSPNNSDNNFSEPKRLVINSNAQDDLVDFLITDIQAPPFNTALVMGWEGRVEGDELIFEESPSNQRFVLGEVGIRIFLTGKLLRDDSGAIEGRLSLRFFDEGEAMQDVSLFTCLMEFEPN